MARGGWMAEAAEWSGAGGWEAHHHGGLVVAAAGGGEGGWGRREMCQAQWGLAAARDFDPSSDLPLCNFGPSPFLLSS